MKGEELVPIALNRSCSFGKFFGYDICAKNLKNFPFLGGYGMTSTRRRLLQVLRRIRMLSSLTRGRRATRKEKLRRVKKGSQRSQVLVTRERRT